MKALLVSKILLQVAVFVVFVATMLLSDTSPYDGTTLMLLFMIYLNTGRS